MQAAHSKMRGTNEPNMYTTYDSFMSKLNNGPYSATKDVYAESYRELVMDEDVRRIKGELKG